VFVPATSWSFMRSELRSLISSSRRPTEFSFDLTRAGSRHLGAGSADKGEGFFANDVLKAATSGSSMPLLLPTH
jgi:hypothetical protein